MPMGWATCCPGSLGRPPIRPTQPSISLAELTGVAARRVGVYVGVIFAVLALSPKVTALLIAIPNPVGAAYVTLLIGLLFVQGMKFGGREWPQSPQGRGGGAVVLDWRGLSESGDLCRFAGQDVGHLARQRHDRWGACRDPADRVHGADSSAPPTPSGRIKCRFAAQD